MDFLRLFSRKGPKIKILTTKKDGFSGWFKCSGCMEMVHAGELSEKMQCCPKCNYHYRLPVEDRIKLLADEGTFEELFTNLEATDPLEFADEESYKERLERAKAKTGRDEAVATGLCEIQGEKAALAVFDFSFMGGSMGSVVGERLTRLIELATERKLPLVIVSSSGGARMQESIFSLMQMAKTSSALTRLSEKKIPFISILTNPTLGGVTASFATLGDVIIAEPGALIGFAGPRVVEQAMRKKLPDEAQTAEFLEEKGMIDAIVSRERLKATLAYFITFLMPPKEREEISRKSESYVTTTIKKLFGVT